ncbi:MAG: hypothetical protein LBE35_02100 [Clostridiales bacterium]|jgi:hypothetical protein|nr:hypothetical protein [Clostridiales bacterium]
MANSVSYELYAELEKRLAVVEAFTGLSTVTEIWSASAPLSNVGVAVIVTGFQHNCWGIGATDHVQTLSPNVRYTIITAAQYPPLALYQGAPTVGTLFIMPPGGINVMVPLFFDDTGIYFEVPNTMSGLPIGTALAFTQLLILIPPST